MHPFLWGQNEFWTFLNTKWPEFDGSGNDKLNFWLLIGLFKKDQKKLPLLMAHCLHGFHSDPPSFWWINEWLPSCCHTCYISYILYFLCWLWLSLSLSGCSSSSSSSSSSFFSSSSSCLKSGSTEMLFPYDPYGYSNLISISHELLDIELYTSPLPSSSEIQSLGKSLPMGGSSGSGPRSAH